MTEAVNFVYDTIDDMHRTESAHTRRQLVAGATATLGSLGLLSALPDIADAQRREPENPQTVLNIAATAEALATCINTVGPEKLQGPTAATRLEQPTLLNIQAAARHELIHYDILVSPGINGRAAATTFHIPDAVFATRENFLQTLVVGDQIFINAYLIAITVFGNRGLGQEARLAAEHMGAEAVHRALARQALGQLGNDRALMKYSQAEEAVAVSNPGQPGFRRVASAVAQLEAAGFGFGKAGSLPGQMYDFPSLRNRTPDPGGGAREGGPLVNTRTFN